MKRRSLHLLELSPKPLERRAAQEYTGASGRWDYLSLVAAAMQFCGSLFHKKEGSRGVKSLCKAKAKAVR
ncbi:MAG: hypothetical protein LBU32_27860 [Clostridiales bacterium]|nr:hypothetical protein [Clostridiales bacterium]